MKTVEAAKMEVIGTIERETEKAVLVAVEVATQCGDVTRNVWWPKSKIEVVAGHVVVGIENAWLLVSKENELAGSVRGFLRIRTQPIM